MLRLALRVAALKEETKLCTDQNNILHFNNLSHPVRNSFHHPYQQLSSKFILLPFLCDVKLIFNTIEIDTVYGVDLSFVNVMTICMQLRLQWQSSQPQM